jgi:uncharacterized protein
VNLDFFVFLIFLLVQWRLAVLFLRRLAPLKSRRRTVARVCMALFGLVLAAGYCCSFASITGRLRLPGRTAPILGALTIAYLLISAVALVLYSVLGTVRRKLNVDADPARRRVLQLAGCAAVATPFAALAYGALIQRTNFEIKEVDIPLPGLPDDLHGLRLLHLSDIHLSVFLTEAELARVIDASRELRPHVAFMTGDFISTFGDPLEACIRQLARLKADAGMLGCLGNHERYAQAEQSTVELGARAGIPILRSQACQLRFGKALINVAGVDYQPMSRKQEYLRGAGRLVYPGALNILLSHNPDVFPVAAAQAYNLVLAGHTHGGQVNLEILDRGINPARFFTPYVQGFYGIGRAAAYVTRGIGTIGIPVRIGAPPEISLLRLRKA